MQNARTSGSRTEQFVGVQASDNGSTSLEDEVFLSLLTPAFTDLVGRSTFERSVVPFHGTLTIRRQTGSIGKKLVNCFKTLSCYISPCSQWQTRGSLPLHSIATGST